VTHPLSRILVAGQRPADLPVGSAPGRVGRIGPGVTDEQYRDSLSRAKKTLSDAGWGGGDILDHLSRAEIFVSGPDSSPGLPPGTPAGIPLGGYAFAEDDVAALPHTAELLRIAKTVGVTFYKPSPHFAESDPPVGAAPIEKQACPPAPSRTGWFALGALTALAGIVGATAFAYSGTTAKGRAKRLASALDEYARSPNGETFGRVQDRALAFATTARELASAKGQEAAALAMRQVDQLRSVMKPADARRWAASWREWL
jgi:hypothetical protein